MDWGVWVQDLAGALVAELGRCATALERIAAGHEGGAPSELSEIAGTLERIANELENRRRESLRW